MNIMNKQMNKQIIDEAIKYCSHIYFTNDESLNEKGREKIVEWCKQDFIAGANYVVKQLILSGVIKSVCLEGNEPIECDQFLALGNCEKCTHFNKQSNSNEFRPNLYISDDLEDLKKRYTTEQLQKMWKDVYPKSSEINGKVIITGTSE